MEIIAVDMDDVLTCYTDKVLKTLFTETGLSPEISFYQGRFLSDALPEEYRLKVSSYPFRKNFFRDLEVMPDCQRVLQKLSGSFRILIVSACLQHPDSIIEKISWMKQFFPFLHYKQLVFCGEKDNVRADFLIDDHPGHLEKFSGKPILFTSWQNLHEKRFFRVNNWMEIEILFCS